MSTALQRDTKSIANTEMAAAWDGPEGERWTEDADRYDAACKAYERWLFETAALEPRDAVLDVGCGCGVTTRRAARVASAGRALGVDLSSRMLARAEEQSREEGLTNARFEQGDVQVHPLEPRAFDAAISHFGAMFFADPIAAFTNVARALRPAGRLTMLTWQPLDRNPWVLAIRDSLAAGRALKTPSAGTPGPFGLAEPDAIRRILASAGYGGIEIDEVAERVFFGRDVQDAFAFASRMGMARSLLDGLDERTRSEALGTLRDRLAAGARPDGVSFEGHAWRITAVAP